MPDLARWQEMVRPTGRYAQPIRLQGHRLTFGAGLEVLDANQTADQLPADLSQPVGVLLVAVLHFIPDCEYSHEAVRTRESSDCINLVNWSPGSLTAMYSYSH